MGTGDHPAGNQLSGLNALVTGASRGIGRAIARRFAAEGAHVVLSASRAGRHGDLSGTLEEAVDEIRRSGGAADLAVCNLIDDEARSDLVERAAASAGPIDIVVNNAAMSRWSAPSTTTLSDRRKMMEVNFHAPVDIAQQALPGMTQRGRGWILNISSETARQIPVPYRGPKELVSAIGAYGTTKAALERYTEALAHEVVAAGVFVNALAPVSIVLTDGAEELVGDIARRNPDMVEPPEVMAEAALELCSRPHVGRVTSSRALLHSVGRCVRDLSGRETIGDAFAGVDFSAA